MTNLRAVVRRVALSALLASFVLVGALAAPAAAQEPPLTPVACPHPVIPFLEPFLSRLECARLRVPVDYRHPDGATMEVEISLQHAQRPEARRGVLLINPGGPGGSGLVDFALVVGLLYPPEVTDAYDIIGFDPRGGGESSPISCDLTDEELFLSQPWLLPGGVRESAVFARDTAERCVANAGPTLRYITTANTARDMDSIRAALGEEKISYYGGSYGAYLGAAYATLFPDRTDRVVIDSTPDPNSFGRPTFRAWGPGMEIRFSDFARFAAARDAEYGLGDTPERVRETYFALTTRLDSSPLPTPEGPFNGNFLRQATFLTMHEHSEEDDEDELLDFPSLAELWRAVANDDGATAGTYIGDIASDTNNAIAVAEAVLCGDVSWPHSISRYEQDVRRDSSLYPLVGSMAANITPCAFWPDPIESPIHVTPDGPANVLILQNRRDPGTPYAGALEARREFGKRARLVSVDQGGHGVFVFGGNPCPDEIAGAFLAGGPLPSEDISCPAPPEDAAARAATTLLNRNGTISVNGGGAIWSASLRPPPWLLSTF